MAPTLDIPGARTLLWVSGPRFPRGVLAPWQRNTRLRTNAPQTTSAIRLVDFKRFRPSAHREKEAAHGGGGL